jgi:predicted Zn finger-like uncharacterized protein
LHSRGSHLHCCGPDVAVTRLAGIQIKGFVMTIECPSCKRKFRIDDRLLKGPHQKLRCSRCGHVFRYSQQTERDDDGDEFNPPVFEPLAAKDHRSRRGILILVLSLLVLAFVAAAVYFGGYAYWQKGLRAGSALGFRNLEGQETITRDTRVFVVNGMVVNQSTRPRKYVMLKAKLLDREGTIFAESGCLAGLAVSKEEVQQTEKVELVKKLADYRSSNIQNFVLEGKRELPFTIVFFDVDPPGKAKEFTVEVYEAPL